MSFGTHQHRNNNSHHNSHHNQWGGPSSHEDTWNQRKRPRHFQDEVRRRSGDEPSRPVDYDHSGHKPELHRRTTVPNDSSSFVAPSDDPSSRPYSYLHEKGPHNVNNNNNDNMCNPHQNPRTGPRMIREEEGIHREGTFGARRRSQSPPRRGYPSSRDYYDMDRGYPESGGPRENERSYRSTGGTTMHYQEPPTYRSTPDVTLDRETVSQSSHQRDSRTGYPDRHERERGDTYKNGVEDRHSYSNNRMTGNGISRYDASRAVRGYNTPQEFPSRRPEDVGIPLRRSNHDMEIPPRRPDDMEFPHHRRGGAEDPHYRRGVAEDPHYRSGVAEDPHYRHGHAEFPRRRQGDGTVPQRRSGNMDVPYDRPGNRDVPWRRQETMDRRPDSEPSRDARRNDGAYSDSYRPLSRGVAAVGDQQRLSTTGCATDAYLSGDKKRSMDHPQEQYPPRKRSSPIEPKIAPSHATQSTTAPPGGWESAAKPVNGSAPPTVTKAPPVSPSRTIEKISPKEPSANPHSTTARPTSEPPRATSSPGDLTGKDDISPSTTSTSQKVMAAGVLVKEKTSSGIPMRWLKPANKPKIKVAIPKEATKLQDAGKAKASDTVSSIVIPRQMKKNDCSAPTSPACNRMVTDSEGGSTASTSLDLLAMIGDGKAQAQVPVAIVTTKAAGSRTQVYCAPKKSAKSFEERGQEPSVERNSSQSDSDSSDTDDDEVRNWASVMFGLNVAETKKDEEKKDGGNMAIQKAPLKLRLKLSPSKIAFLKAQRKELKKSEKTAEVAQAVDWDPAQPRIKLKERGRTKKNRRTYLEAMPEVTAEEREVDEELQRIERQDEIRIREEAKPLTAAQIREILGEDEFDGSSSSNWVRRSVRQPSLALLNSKPLKALVAGLKNNHPDMVVLKMKKYINDPDAPSCVIDAALEALEENSNCEALYIQNFNEGMRDRQVLHLLKILQSPQCRIWCMNIGENYNVEMETWDKFTKGLRKTKITHMYASEHTITTEMKDEIRETIRENRTKHDLHVNPNNLDVIVQCTHCWWNPINAKVLRPYIRNRGYEHILNDKEGQGLRGSMSEAPSL